MSKLDKMVGGGNCNASKKLYTTPELRVIDIVSSDIICTSNGGELPRNPNSWD